MTGKTRSLRAVTRVTRAVVGSMLWAVTLCAAACGTGAPAADAAPHPSVSASAQATLDEHGSPVGLHNYHKWSERIGGGAQPEGEEAFRNLVALGYRVVLSVDGARPDVETATKYGLRYIHIPFGYDGVPEEARLEIAKTVVTAEGPIYFHCHHGKHRGPAAIAVACVETEGMTREAAKKLLETCGTDPKYKGLYAAAETCRVPSADEIAAVSAELSSYRAPSDLAQTMVDVDARWDHLNASKSSAWGVPPKNPDVDPPHEALMLWEHFREIARMPRARERGDAFLASLTESETSAKALEAALRAKDIPAADAAYERSRKSCAACHTKFRDNGDRSLRRLDEP
jgi:protein tyrosine phosphatase (PTP) superfamily phosphohydrolase (DUF442 family)